MNQSREKHELLGEVPRLPLSIAVQVAKSSIKVRLSRSLVTVSSVILAVAFLLVVMGEDISDRAVYAGYSADQQPSEDLAAISAALTRPRSDRELLELLATDDDIGTWADRYGVDLAAYDAARAEDLVQLAGWIDDLKATDRFQVLGTSELMDWILHFDDEGRADRFLARVELFRGVRLPLAISDIEELARGVGKIRAAVTDLRAAEAARLAVVAEHGGEDAVVARIAGGETGPQTLQDLGVPVYQLLGTEQASQRLAAVAQQAHLTELTIRAQQAIARANRAVAAAAPIGPDMLLDERLASQSSELQAALASLPDERRSSLREELVARPAIEPLRSALGGLPGLSEAARLDEVLAPSAVQAYLAELQLSAALDADEQATLVAHLRERARLNELREAFRAAGFDPTAGGTRTFWLLVLSFLVCVVGIVNSMMMAVTERFREIATMKCLGAMDGFILKAFMIESGSVGVVGALMGSVLGLIIVVAQASLRYGGTFYASFPGGLLGLATLGALGCGVLLTIIGALLPAYRAARMHPIEAMRLEA